MKHELTVTWCRLIRGLVMTLLLSLHMDASLPSRQTKPQECMPRPSTSCNVLLRIGCRFSGCVLSDACVLSAFASAVQRVIRQSDLPIFQDLIGAVCCVCIMLPALADWPAAQQNPGSTEPHEHQHRPAQHVRIDSACRTSDPALTGR